MLVSVIITMYNTENYIEECLQSIAKQSFPSYEVIIIDDGSTDSSGMICDEYSKKDPRIKVIHQKNTGIAIARNVAIDIAQGDYLIFVDSDDWMDPDMLKKMTDAAKNTGADLVCCSVVDVIQGKNVERRIWKEDVVLEGAAAYDAILSNTVTMWNKLVARELFEGHRFDPTYRHAEDALFFSEALMNMKKAALLKDCLYFYRIDRPGNVVSANLNVKHVHLVWANYKVFTICREDKKRYSAGIDRVYCAITTVLRDIARHPEQDPKEYYDAIHSCANKMKMRWLALRDSKVLIKQILILSCRVSPKLLGGLLKKQDKIRH